MSSDNGIQTYDKQTAMRDALAVKGAQTLAWLDMHLTNRQPYFLGRKEPIGI